MNLLSSSCRFRETAECICKAAMMVLTKRLCKSEQYGTNTINLQVIYSCHISPLPSKMGAKIAYVFHHTRKVLVVLCRAPRPPTTFMMHSTRQMPSPLSLPLGPVPPSLSSSTLAGCLIPRSNTNPLSQIQTPHPQGESATPSTTLIIHSATHTATPGGLSPPLSLPRGPVPPSLSSSTLAGCSIPRFNTNPLSQIQTPHTQGESATPSTTLIIPSATHTTTHRGLSPPSPYLGVPFPLPFPLPPLPDAPFPAPTPTRKLRRRQRGGVGWGGACAQLRPRSHFVGPFVCASCLHGPWFPVCRVSLSDCAPCAALNGPICSLLARLDADNDLCHVMFFPICCIR